VTELQKLSSKILVFYIHMN